VTVAKSLVIQTGANAYDTLSISIGDMSADALGLSGSNIATRSSAAAAITAVRNAIVEVATNRATLGAMQNRL
jgi:flagellin